MALFRTPQIVLFTRDIDRSVAFYRALGFEEAFRTPATGTPIHVDLTLDGYRLGLATEASTRDDHGLDPVASGQRAAVILWTDDVPSGYDRLLELGATPVRSPSPWLDRLLIAWAEDPDGHLVQVVQTAATTINESDQAAAAAAEPDGSLSAFVAEFPDPAELERRFRILTIIDAVLTDRNFTYTYARAMPHRDFRVARYDNGAGDLALAFFEDDGAFVRAYQHHDDAAWLRTFRDGDDANPWVRGLNGEVLLGMPDRFEPFTRLPQLEHEGWDPESDEPSISLALWHTGDGWKHGSPEPDSDGDVVGSAMFRLLVGEFTAATIAADRSPYYGRDLDPATLEPFVTLEALTRERVLALNDTPDWEMLATIAEQGGYPSELASAAPEVDDL